MAEQSTDPMLAGAVNAAEASNIFEAEAKALSEQKIKEYERAKVEAAKTDSTAKAPEQGTGTTAATATPPVAPAPPAPPEADKLKRAALRNAKTNDMAGASLVQMLKGVPYEKVSIRQKAEFNDMVDAWEDFLKENPDAQMPAWAQLAIINLTSYGIHFIDPNKIMSLFGGAKPAPAAQQVYTQPAQTTAAKPAAQPAAAAPAKPMQPAKPAPAGKERGPAPKCACGCGNDVKWVNGKWQKYLNIAHSNEHKARTGTNKPKEKQHTTPAVEK